MPDGLPESRESKILKNIQEFLNDPKGAKQAFNERFLRDELRISRPFLNNVDVHPLTEEQRTAVAVDDDRNLVVAAAGSGKTSLILAKAAWQVESRRRRADEILILAFARNARNEIAERIRRCLGEPTKNAITVQTFHELGLSIIGKAEGKRPTLAKAAEDDTALYSLLENIVKDLILDRSHGIALRNWLIHESTPYRSAHEFHTWQEYWDYLRKHNIRALQGEQVKSFEECRIANFLYLNGVEYKYERSYEYDTRTENKQQYKPDFYLIESGIYIEHFALSESGRTPAFIDDQKYRTDRQWKIDLHTKKGTVLIQTFSYQQKNGNLIQTLKEQLHIRGVNLKPISHEKVFRQLNKQQQIGPFIKMLSKFIRHFKGSGKTMDDLHESDISSLDAVRKERFLKVFPIIFEKYQKLLSSSAEIDFQDMISRATGHVASKRYRSPFGYILVDEFQDISPDRAALLKALLDQSENTQLLAVGDDWQAIFRYGGADIRMMSKFPDQFGASTRCDLSTTFRCSAKLSDVATRFILRNPEQIRKIVRSNSRIRSSGVRVGLGSEKKDEKEESLLDEALNHIADDAPKSLSRLNVLLLGRYNCKNVEPKLQILREAHPKLDMTFSTIHSAKGIEADYVVVLKVHGGKDGFPCEITDDALIDLVLSNSEQYQFAEERRLLYVALTRARRWAYLLAEGGPRSSFVDELLDGTYRVEVFGSEDRDTGTDSCPRCKTGQMMRRTNSKRGNAFLGCTNFPYCKHTESITLRSFTSNWH